MFVGNVASGSAITWTCRNECK